ncbi:cell division suppressor protein YneA [Candidatus Nanopelagicaceae bacterium]
MSTVSLNAINAQTLINQGFQGSSTNPSGLRLNRRGRLARTFVVLSLAVVLASVFGLKAGAGTTDAVGAPTSFIEVTVAPGDTLWSLATRMADGGDVRAMVDEISSVNSLASAELQAGQKVRIPLR